MVRQKQGQKALALLAAASRTDLSNARYVYVYAVALDDTGQAGAAIETLEHSIKLHPYHRDSLAALVGLCKQARRYADALNYAQRLNELEPGNPQLQETMTGLESRLGQTGDVQSRNY